MKTIYFMVFLLGLSLLINNFVSVNFSDQNNSQQISKSIKDDPGSGGPI
jgi:hypothetical protein